MLELKSLFELDNSSETIYSTYNTAVKTYNIVTSFMDDNCSPIQLGKNLCLWLNKEGIIGELECIYPKLVLTAKCSLESTVTCSIGVPSFNYLSSNREIYVQHFSKKFIVWLAENKVVTNEIRMGSVKFLFSDHELVGVLADDIKIIS